MSARWIRRNVCRIGAHPVALVLDLRQLPPEVAGARGAARGSGRAPSAVAVPLLAGVEREAEDADRVRLARPEERRRHRQVLVDPREHHRLGERVARLSARVGSSGGSPSAIRFALPASISRSCVLVEAGGPRGAQRDQQRARLLAVRVVGRVEDLLGRDLAEEVEQVDRAPGRGVEEDAGLAGEVAQRGAEVGDAGVGDDQLRLGIARRRGARGRRRSAAARGRRGSGSARAARPRSRRPGRAARRSAGSFCARGWSLIPRAPRSRQRSASSIGSSVRSRRTNGISRPSERAASSSVRSFGGAERRDAGRARPCRT